MASSSSDLPSTAQLREHLAHSERVRQSLLARDLAGHQPPSAPPTAALCPACGRCTAARVCVCGCDMQEAQALWKSAGATPVAGGVARESVPAAPAAPRAPAAPVPTVPADADELAASLEETLSAAMRAAAARANEPAAATAESRADRVAALLEQLPAPEQLPARGAASECAVCLQKFMTIEDRGLREAQRLHATTARLVVLPCTHVFHHQCLAQWWVNTNQEPCCALCKRPAGGG